MNQKDAATIPIESCQKLIDTVAQAVNACGAQPDNALDKLSISLAAQADSLTSQGSAISWGATLLAAAAMALGIGWGIVAKMLIEREARKEAKLVAATEAKVEASRLAEEWLDKNLPGLLSAYLAQLDGVSSPDNEADNIAKHADE